MDETSVASAIRQSIAGGAVAVLALMLLLVAALAKAMPPEYLDVSRNAGRCLLVCAAVWVSTAWITTLPDSGD